MYKVKEFIVQPIDNGSIEGYASTWIREPDAYGDVVRKGAFTNSLAKIKAEGIKIPLIWSHQLDKIDSYIGTAEAEEDEKGLHFVATFEDTPEAQKVRQMYMDRRLSKFSFAYNILDQGSVMLADGRKANELRELEIFEISCVLVPANSDATVTSIKADKIETKEDSEEITEKSDSDNAAQAEDQNTLNGIKEYLLLLIKSME